MDVIFYEIKPFPAMSQHRKFNAMKFLSAFEGHESELSALLRHHRLEPEEKLTIAGVHPLLMNTDTPKIETLVACLHELNDLSSPVGREVMEQVCESMDIEAPAEDMTSPRAACWLYLHEHQAFERAMQLLTVRALEKSRVVLVPGKQAQAISDPDEVVRKMRDELRAPLHKHKKTDSLAITHYEDGNIFGVIVFCERIAEVQMEFGKKKDTVMSKVRRPADQFVLLYHQGTGHLEIEGGRHKERDILRLAFAKAAFNDKDFFPPLDSAKLLDLDRMIHSDFKLPTRPGHVACLTALKLSGKQEGKRVTFDFCANRKDIVEVLHSRQMLGGAVCGMTVESARIELTIERTRAGRKSIELVGGNGIKFNRTAYADVVYDYLRNWQILADGLAPPTLI